jgi:hypothetical protein
VNANCTTALPENERGPASIAPEILEPVRRKCRVTHSVLNIPVVENADNNLVSFPPFASS